MKILLLAAASAAVLMTGCASTPKTADGIAYDDGVDYRRVAAIDHIARVRGVTVKWINYPQKRSTAVGVAPSMEPTGT